MFGWTGKILRVGLTHKTIEEEKLDLHERELYLGGRGLGVKWVYDRGPVEPLAPLQNRFCWKWKAIKQL